MYCCTPKALYNHEGGLSSNHHQCAASTWMMRRQPQYNGASALTTHQLQVERRESHRAKWMGIIRRSWLTRASGSNLARTPGSFLLFKRNAMGFLMTTENQDLGLTSHPKDYHVPILGHLGPTQTTGWTPPAGLTNSSSSSNLVFPWGLPSRYWPGSTLLSFSGQPVLGCRVIWLWLFIHF